MKNPSSIWLFFRSSLIFPSQGYDVRWKPFKHLREPLCKVWDFCEWNLDFDEVFSEFWAMQTGSAGSLGQAAFTAGQASLAASNSRPGHPLSQPSRSSGRQQQRTSQPSLAITVWCVMLGFPLLLFGECPTVFSGHPKGHRQWSFRKVFLLAPIHLLFLSGCLSRSFIVNICKVSVNNPIFQLQSLPCHGCGILYC